MNADFITWVESDCLPCTSHIKYETKLKKKEEKYKEKEKTIVEKHWTGRETNLHFISMHPNQTRHLWPDNKNQNFWVNWSMEPSR